MLLELLRETGAVEEGHFLLSSGKHSNGYIQCSKLMMYPEKGELAVKDIVKKLRDIDFDKVLGPALGGIIVSYELARQMGKPSVFSERVDGQMTLRRGFEIRKGEKVLIVEDVVTTGKSALEAIKVVEDLGGKVVGIACLVDRSNGHIGYPLYSGLKLDIKTYEADTCPLCKENMEVSKPGSRNIKK